MSEKIIPLYSDRIIYNNADKNKSLLFSCNSISREREKQSDCDFVKRRGRRFEKDDLPICNILGWLIEVTETILKVIANLLQNVSNNVR